MSDMQDDPMERGEDTPADMPRMRPCMEGEFGKTEKMPEMPILAVGNVVIQDAVQKMRAQMGDKGQILRRHQNMSLMQISKVERSADPSVLQNLRNILHKHIPQVQQQMPLMQFENKTVRDHLRVLQDRLEFVIG
jgi:hypothetical protein